MSFFPTNFSALDLLACLASGVLFSLFGLVPGYTVGWFADLFDFRQRSLVARVAIAIPLSAGIAPALAYLAGRFLSMSAVWGLFGLIWLAFGVLMLRGLFSTVARPVFGKLPRAHAMIVGGWLAAGILSLIDLQIKDRLYFSIVSFDYQVRAAVVNSISRTGIPPANPFFFPGHAVPLRYHYFWLIPCSLVDTLGGSLVSARHAIFGGVLWCGMALIAVVVLYLRFFHPAGARDIYRRSLIGVALLAVTGLDILPNLARDLAGLPLPDPEWWNSIQVSSWVTSVLWVPHHTGALIAGLMGTLVIWNSAQAVTFARRAFWMVIAGLCLATCLGSSIYVGLVFGVALFVWTCILLCKRWNGEVVFAVAAGCVALAVVLRHLLDLRGDMSGAPGTGPLIVFHVADFVFSGLFGDWIHGSVVRLNLVNALLLPVNYLLELGAFLLAGIWTLRRWCSPSAWDRYRLATLAFAATSVLICTFVRSSVIANNDLGARGFLLAQFVLILWMTDILDLRGTLSYGRRLLLGALLILGVAGSLHEALVLRAYPIASDVLDIPRQNWLSRDRNLGRRTYALRSGYEALRTALPPGAIVQHNPNAVPGDLPWGLYADRPVAAETPACNVVFGGDPRDCVQVQAKLTPIFEGVSSLTDVDRACRDLSIAAILVKDTDPAWGKRDGWAWQREPLAGNQFMRAIPCNPSPGR